MKVRVSFTVDVDYDGWKEIRAASSVPDTSEAACRRNVVALAEEAFEHAMDDYVSFEWV